MILPSKSKSKIIVIFAAVIATANTGCSVFGAKTVEEPSYTLIQSSDNFEIREYKSQLIAKTKMTKKKDGSSNSAFKVIAKFIFGDNKKSTAVAMTAPVVEEGASVKVAMTSPVVESFADNDGYMYFVMPSEYTLETLPKPLNKDITVEVLPAKTVAVFKYSGFVTSSKLQENSEKLYRWIQKKDLKYNPKYRSARYNPPWTIPFLRRNEIHVTIIDGK